VRLVVLQIPLGCRVNRSDEITTMGSPKGEEKEYVSLCQC